MGSVRQSRTSPDAIHPTPTEMGWEARLDLGFVAARGTTLLTRRRHHGPVYVQRPFRPEGPEVCHVYLLHPPGGLVGGDDLRFDVAVDEGAAALLTTPAAGKAYRTSGPVARQSNRLRVATGGTLEWLPQEIIVYDGADAVLDTRVELAADARFVGAETICLGLPARDAPFVTGACRQVFEIWREGRPLLVERGRIAGGDPAQAGRWGLGGASVVALLAAAPAPVPSVVDEVRALAAAALGGDLAATTVLGEDDLLVCRFLGSSAERARAFIVDAWRLLRPALMGRAAVAPRIWAT
jgi:urease accessory protein